jgi:endonuclease YncB( thermonuclease family)
MRFASILLRFRTSAAALICIAGLFAPLAADQPPNVQQAPRPASSPAMAEVAPPVARVTTGAALRRAPFPGPYQISLLRTVDGDTFEARVRIWFGQDVATLVRIRGIDAPELRARCGHERVLAEAARDALDAALRSGAVEISDVVPDKYFGRIVASVRIIEVSGGVQDTGTFMLGQKHARAYDGRKRAGWCETAALE